MTKNMQKTQISGLEPFYQGHASVIDLNFLFRNWGEMNTNILMCRSWPSNNNWHGYMPKFEKKHEKNNHPVTFDPFYEGHISVIDVNFLLRL